MDAHTAQAAEKIRPRANKVHRRTAADNFAMLLSISIYDSVNTVNFWVYTSEEIKCTAGLQLIRQLLCKSIFEYPWVILGISGSLWISV